MHTALIRVVFAEDYNPLRKLEFFFLVVMEQLQQQKMPNPSQQDSPPIAAAEEVNHPNTLHYSYNFIFCFVMKIVFRFYVHPAFHVIICLYLPS